MESHDFAGTARRLAAAARARGLDSPGFRTPPRQAGYDRTIRRYPDGTALVAVRVKGRLWDDVVDDLIAGVLTVNDLHGALAAEVRLALWSELVNGPVRPSAALGRSPSAALGRSPSAALGRSPSAA